MNIYTINGMTFNGVIVLCYVNGMLAMIDLCNAELTDLQRKQYFTNLSLMESEFVERAKRSGANYTKS